MPTYRDLLRFAHTGIASPDMTHFDKTRALAALGGGKTQTLTGIPPLSFKADGTPLISWSMLGNGQQTGTPTPSAPVDFVGCGDRTWNLFDATTIEAGIYITANGNKYGNKTNGVRSGTKIKASPNTAYTLSAYSAENISLRILEWSNGTFKNQTPKYNISGSVSLTVTTGAETTEIAFNIEGGNAQYATNIMLNTGSTALPYEPYGYKIPISSAGQTNNIYLGEVETTRKIKKLVLTGEENWDKGTYAFYRVITGIMAYKPVLCTHYQYYDGVSSGAPTDSISTGSGGGAAIWIKTQNHADTTIEQWKSYLAAQYAAGTPVTVWYVLAETETAIVNEPLAKIGDYADELHSTDAGVSIPTVKGSNTLTVDTELQPSEMTVTYRG